MEKRYKYKAILGGLFFSMFLGCENKKNNSREEHTLIEEVTDTSMHSKNVGENDLESIKERSVISPDTKVNNLELVNPNSIINSIGDIEKEVKEEEGLPLYYYRISTKKPYLNWFCFPDQDIMTYINL